jgi:hypothetical protein
MTIDALAATIYKLASDTITERFQTIATPGRSKPEEVQSFMNSFDVEEKYLSLPWPCILLLQRFLCNRTPNFCKNVLEAFPAPCCHQGAASQLNILLSISR